MLDRVHYRRPDAGGYKPVFGKPSRPQKTSEECWGEKHASRWNISRHRRSIVFLVCPTAGISQLRIRGLSGYCHGNKSQVEAHVPSAFYRFSSSKEKVGIFRLDNRTFISSYR